MGHRRREVSRIEGFSDGVFAFAITLLIVSLEVPKTFDELMHVIRAFPVFAVSFALLFQIWWRHYRFFRRYDIEDATVIALTGVLLFVVLFFVYPLKFLWSLLYLQIAERATGAEMMRLDQVPALFFVYGGGIVATFGILATLYRHAFVHRVELELDPVEVLETRVDVYRNVAIAALGLLSILLAAILPSIASPRWLGLAGWVYGGIGITEWQLGAYLARQRKKVEGAPQTLPL
jgi:uncharacterized membrane protein